MSKVLDVGLALLVCAVVPYELRASRARKVCSTPSSRSRAHAVLWIAVVAGIIPGVGAGQYACPDGTRLQRNGCVLDADLVLDEPLELPSFTELNCRGHRLMPSSTGSGDSIATYVASSPSTAIVVTGSRGVTIKNCIVGDPSARFDFGIIVMSSKNPGPDGHALRNNDIHARDAAITLLRVDDAAITDNRITWTNGCGVAVRRDSDRNRITNNLLSSPGAPAMPARIVPDGPFAQADLGIAIVGGPTQPLLNVVAGGRLFQFPNLDEGAYPTTDDNLLEGNALSLPGASVGKDHSAILIAGKSARTRVIGNTITRAGTGIRIAGLPAALTVTPPSRCVGTGGTTERYCASQGDCFIPGVDLEPLGTCPALAQEVIDSRGRDTVAEGNTLIGPFNSTTPQFRAGIFGGNGTVGAVIRRNVISGSGTETGISLAGYTIESGEVTNNVVVGAAFGLQLSSPVATSFGARVSRNDFVDSTLRAVGVLGSYGLPTELSWDGEGNYWGHSMPPCFAPEDSPDFALVRDSNAYCAPIAARSTLSER